MERSVRRMGIAFAVAAATMFLWGAPCEAQPSQATVHFQLDRGGTPPGSPPEIKLITANTRYVGLCRNWNPQRRRQCDKNQIQWHLTILGGPGLAAGEEVKILNAPNHAACFNTIPFTFDDTNTSGSPPFTHDSGPAKVQCAQDKYGTYWPYVIEYWNNDVLEASTDPGGIIFP